MLCYSQNTDTKRGVRSMEKTGIVVEGWTIYPSTFSIEPVAHIEKREDQGKERIYAALIYVEGQLGTVRASEVSFIDNVHKTIADAAQYLRDDITEKKKGEFEIEGWMINFSTLFIQPVTYIEKREDRGEEKIYAALVYYDGQLKGGARTSERIHISKVYETESDAGECLCNYISTMSEI